MTLAEQPVLDSEKLQAFVHKAVGDWGTLTSATLVVIGDKLNLYGSLATDGPATPAELAARTATVETYVRPWLINQAAGGYLEYDAASGRYSLPPEHAAALVMLGGAYELFTSMIKAEPRITEGFRTGRGMHWGEHDAGVFSGCERFFRPGYEQHLVQEWVPRWTASRGSSTAAARSPTLAVVTGHPPSSWRAPTRTPHWSVSIVTSRQLSALERLPRQSA